MLRRKGALITRCSRGYGVDISITWPCAYRDVAEKCSFLTCCAVAKINLYYYFFRADESTRLENGRQLFSRGLEDFDKCVLVCLYVFKQTMRAFFELLRIAYEFRGFEVYYIHDRVIALLRDLLTEPSSTKGIVWSTIRTKNSRGAAAAFREARFLVSKF